MLLTIENLFDQILKIVKQKRKANTSFDGKNFWQPIKKVLSESLTLSALPRPDFRLSLCG